MRPEAPETVNRTRIARGATVEGAEETFRASGGEAVETISMP
jgi:hypothetical protein